MKLGVEEVSKVDNLLASWYCALHGVVFYRRAVSYYVVVISEDEPDHPGQVFVLYNMFDLCQGGVWDDLSA